MSEGAIRVSFQNDPAQPEAAGVRLMVNYVSGKIKLGAQTFDFMDTPVYKRAPRRW